MFAWIPPASPCDLWLVVGGVLVVMTIAVVGTRRSNGRHRRGPSLPVWIDSVRRGTMPLQIRSNGTVVTGDHLPCGLSFRWTRLKARWCVSGKRRKWITRTGRSQGRLIDVFKNGDNGVTSVFAEFGSDAPEKRPGSEIIVTIDAGSTPNVLFVGRPAFERSNSEGSLFRMDPRTGYRRPRARRFGRVVGNFAEIVDGLKEGDKVILSDMTGYEHVRRIRFD